MVPPLALADAGATLQAVNFGYVMELEPRTWQNTGSLAIAFPAAWRAMGG